MNLIEDLKWRGLIKDQTDEAKVSKLLSNKTTLYVGIDPTGDSMHVGHLLPVLILKRFQRAGHQVIAVVGGGTGLIGDPSGKKSARQLLALEQSISNGQAIQKQVEHFLDQGAIIENNINWLGEMNVITFLRDFGRYFGVNYMLAKDTVASRLETGISFTEFSYQILQSIDFLKLYEMYGCMIQVGGSDQWGNITAGLELIRKVHGDNLDVCGITNPLITKADGGKFGKTESGTIFINPELTSPYEFYQFWINVADRDVINYLKMFTFLSKEEIEEIEQSFNENPGLRVAQKALAKEMTIMCHSQEAYEKALAMSQMLFSGDISSLTYQDLQACFSGLTPVEVSEDLNIVDCLVQTKICSSKREAREFVKNNSIMINGVKVNDETFIVARENAYDQKTTIIRRGKKNYFVINHN